MSLSIAVTAMFPSTPVRVYFSVRTSRPAMLLFPICQLEKPDAELKAVSVLLPYRYNDNIGSDRMEGQCKIVSLIPTDLASNETSGIGCSVEHSECNTYRIHSDGLVGITTFERARSMGNGGSE